jgi:exonuclease SbcC
MIPIHLSIYGFLSYRDPVEIDFRRIDLACVSGSNGAGKSSLLDAVTWALFGQARKRDDSLINAQSGTAMVSLVFEFEGNLYRVQRSKTREKTAMLEFQIWQGLDRIQPNLPEALGEWKPLTERTLRETEERIRQTLRMDYDTFTNASFFLQGKADQFTQQAPGDRKRILSSILGLEVWEVYRQQAAERRRQVELEIAIVEARLREINAELVQEPARKERMSSLEQELKRARAARRAQEKLVEGAHRIAATLEQQQRLVETIGRQWKAAEGRWQEARKRLEERQQERSGYLEILKRAEQVETEYRAWLKAREMLGKWDETANRFHEQQLRRQAPLAEIEAERARLEQETQTLLKQRSQLANQDLEIARLIPEIVQLNQRVAEAEAKLARRAELEASLQAARQQQADARAENPRLKEEMQRIKERIERLKEVEGALCPLCGQPLSAEQRQELLSALHREGTEMGDRYRANLALLRESDARVSELEAQITGLSQVEVGLRSLMQTLAQNNARFEGLRKQKDDWEANGAVRLSAIQATLEQETYAVEARRRLAEIDAELRAIGYDAAAHDAIRQQELRGRESEAAQRRLGEARAALEPLEREISELCLEVARQESEVSVQREEYDRAAASLESAREQAPDLEAAEKELLAIQERENLLNQQVGAARQEVAVLEDLKSQRIIQEARRAELARRSGQYKLLERAFGKDGVPALLIEQALPEIESKANDLLDRLSGGNMSVRFITQAPYKDQNRRDLKETLDIQISDSAGTRDYEMYSGGEAFRVNFAIRLALSEVLAQRAGARLQTLVIDEGFGSQDAQGRQRLIEAINLVRADFAKILVITHIEELKDVFPSRIEVEKTERGSLVRIVDALG